VYIETDARLAGFMLEGDGSASNAVTRLRDEEIPSQHWIWLYRWATPISLRNRTVALALRNKVGGFTNGIEKWLDSDESLP
jgi:hypothetical protein